MRKQRGHWGRISGDSEPLISNSENMLRSEVERGEDGAERRSGKRTVCCWEHRNGKIEKPAAGLGCVGGKGLGLAVNMFMTQRLLCVCVQHEPVTVCVRPLPGQVCSHLIPTPLNPAE